MFFHMIQRNMDVEKVPTLEKGQNSRVGIPKSIVNGVLPNQVLPLSQFVCPASKIQLFKGTLFIFLCYIKMYNFQNYS